MTLQVRRGTNSERLGITPLQGELIFTTDTKQLYVGDGATAGGITSIANTIDSLLADNTPQLGGELDLNGNNIVGTGNININGTITASGNINLGDGAGDDVISLNGVISGHVLPQTDTTWNIGAPTFQFKEAWISQLNVENQLTVGRINGDLIADDSTVVFDASTGLIASAQLTGTLPAGVIPAAMSSNITGNLTGNAAGDHTGTFAGSVTATGTLDGDLTGSVFGDDSTLLVDGVNGQLVGPLITDTITSITNDEITIKGRDGLSGNFTTTIAGLDGSGVLNFTRNSALDLGGDQSVQYGTLLFERDDANGVLRTGAISSGEANLSFQHNTAGVTGTEAFTISIANGKLGIGRYVATEALDVVGNAIVTGFVQFGSLTTTERNALTAANGMVIYNTTDNKFQGYENAAWVNLI